MDLRSMVDVLKSGKSIFDLPLKVVYYARVSTDNFEQLNSLSNQVTYYEQYIKNNSNWQYIGGYVDEGISGTSVNKRNNFLKMIRDGKERKFDLVVTKEISRFSRNTLDSIKYTQELLSHGVGVYFQSDNICTINADAELRLTIMSSIAQDEVRKLSERVRFGYKRAIENGKVLGQDNTLGYDKKDGKLTINEKEAVIVRTIFEMYVQGNCGLRKIARELEKNGILSSVGKMYSYETLKNIITNPKYKGFYCGKKFTTLDYRNSKKIRLDESEWVVYKDENIPAIVSEGVWDESNRLIKQRGEKFKDHSDAFQNRYPYSGKIFCAEHGTSFHRHVYKSKQEEKEVWNCKMYRLKGREEGCNSPTIYTNEINQILTHIYNDIYKDFSKIFRDIIELYLKTDDCRNYKKEIEMLEREIKSIKAKKDRLLEISIDGAISNKEFKERNNGFNKHIALIDLQIDSLKDEMALASERKQDDSIFLTPMKKEIYDREYLDSKLAAIILEKIVVYKTGNNNHIKLEIVLKFGDKYVVEYYKKDGKILYYDKAISKVS